MQENKLFETLLDVIPFAAYAVDIDTYEMVYANKLMSENLYAPREEFCWKKIFGQEEICSWCTIEQLKKRKATYKSEKLISNFFDEVTDNWLQVYDELVKWPDGRTVKYTIAVDITEQKEIQASMITTHTKMAMQSQELKEANEKLELMAKKDFLTAVNNRGNFFKLGDDVFKEDKGQSKDIFVAMFDLDKFKSLNDNYSHKVGDLALQAFTKKVEQHLAETDIFGRIGGEEFALILSSQSDESIIEKIQMIRKDIEKIIIQHDNQEIHFTVSIGLVKKEPADTLAIALERADKELYNAKNTGRNRLNFRL